MTITAKVIAHSRASGAPDLITLEARYPRFIHAENKTHRVMSIDDAFYEFLEETSFMDEDKFSRNASSSRAIPIEKMIQSVIDDPAMPVAWGSNKPGMQAGEECTNAVHIVTHDDPRAILRWTAQEAWEVARDRAVEIARGFAAAGYHKQIVNRLLEPFGHITVVVTATEWSNFFDLRCHPDADPTMRALAEAMRDAIQASVPAIGGLNGLHLPYVDMRDIQNWPVTERPEPDWHTLAMISAARCARVSYLNHDGTKPDIGKDLALARRLLDSKHMSPFEHQAIADPENWNRHQHANFRGWRQHRHMVAA